MIGNLLKGSGVLLCVAALTGCTSSYRATLQTKAPEHIPWQQDYTFSPDTLAALRYFGITEQTVPSEARYQLSTELAAGRHSTGGYWLSPSNNYKCMGCPAPNDLMLNPLLTYISFGIIPTYERGEGKIHSIFTEPFSERTPRAIRADVPNADAHHRGGRDIVSSEAATVKKRNLMSFLPLVWLAPGKKLAGDTAGWAIQQDPTNLLPEQNNIAIRLTLSDLAKQIAQEEPKLKRYLKTGSPDEHLAFVKKEPWGILHGAALNYAWQKHPRKNDLAWHAQQREDIPDYALFLPDELAIYFRGPKGLAPWDLAQRLKKGEKPEALLPELHAHHKEFNVWWRSQPLSSCNPPIFNRLYE